MRADDPSHPRVRALRQMRQWFDQGQLGLGDPVPSELVLAERLGIGRSAVRWAMRSLEAEGLIGVEGKGRVMRRSVHGDQPAGGSLLANAVAILGGAPHPGSYQASTGWDCYVGISAEQAIRATGQHALMMSAQALADGGLQRLIVERPRGVLAVLDAGTDHLFNAAIEGLQRSGVPVVGYLASARTNPLPGIDLVLADHAAGGGALVRHLLERGCRRIQRLWAYRANLPPPDWLADREAGVVAALTAAGVEPLPPCYIPSPDGLDGAPDGFAIGVALMAGILAKQLRSGAPDALMVTNDGYASQAITALRWLGLDPTTIPVVGYDAIWRDLPFRAVEPLAPVASIDRDCVAVGAAMVEMLQVRMAAGLRAPPCQRVVTPRLVIYDRNGVPCSPPSVAAGPNV